jgi:hypothetical protein
MVVGVRRRSRRGGAERQQPLGTEAERYASLGWPVCPGAHLSRGVHEPGRACSCDRVGCPAHGAHPASPAWQMQATVDMATIRQWWDEDPAANAVLVTGRVFDVLEVPAVPGALALTKMARDSVDTGPVALLGDDVMHFYVSTRGAPVDEDEWWSCGLDCSPESATLTGEMRWHCRESYVLAPPSRYGAGQSVRWVRPPFSRRALPDAVRMLEYLADVIEERR